MNTVPRMASNLAGSHVRTAPAVSAARPRSPRQQAIERTFGELFRRAEGTFSITALFLFSQALIPALVENQAGAESYEGNAVLRTVFSSIHAVTLLLLVRYFREAVPALARHATLAMLVALAIFSVGWSMAPEVTLRRSFSFLGTTAFGVYLALRYDARTQLKLLTTALGIAAVLSVGFALGLPALGISGSPHAGAWQGVYTEKNTLGQMMALSTIAFLLLRPHLERRRWLAWAGAGLSFALVVLSTSMTALASVLMMLLLIRVFRALRLHLRLVIPALLAFFVIVGVAAAWFATDPEGVLESLGRDPTLTGRTPMWAVVIDMIRERSWLGYGYSAFWLGWRPPSAEALARIGWDTPNAHNGYLDLALQLGLVGVVIFALGVAGVFTRAIAVLRTRGEELAVWPLVFLSYFLVYNMTETIIAAQNHLMWVLYSAVGASSILDARGAVTEREPREGAALAGPGEASARARGRMATGLPGPAAGAGASPAPVWR